MEFFRNQIFLTKGKKIKFKSPVSIPEDLQEDISMHSGDQTEVIATKNLFFDPLRLAEDWSLVE